MTTLATPPPPAPVPPEIIGYKSIAVWEDGPDSTDRHDTKEQAEAICQMLHRDGYGGDGAMFPVSTRVEPIYATRAPLPPAEAKGDPRCGLCFGYGWIIRPVDGVRCGCVAPPAQPTASESSGDVHLANALAEIERLKADLDWFSKRAVDLSNHLFAVDPDRLSRLSPRHNNSVELAKAFITEQAEALAAAHTKALAQEGLIAGLNVALESEKQAKFRIELAHETDTGLLTAERDAALARAETLTLAISSAKHSPNCASLTISTGTKFSPCDCWIAQALATPSPAPVTVPFEQLIVQYLDWVIRTFPGERVVDQIEHLKEEFKELTDAPTDAKEYADVLMLLLCVAHGHGVDVIQAFRDKFAINQARTWEKTEKGWRHVKEAAPLAVGEKDSAGPTPSLRREASESLTNVINNCIEQIWVSITVFDAAAKLPQHEACKLRAKGLRDFIRSLTPPVAGEGGEG